MDEIHFFNRDRAVYSWLRNFYFASITWDGARWPSSEHLYQAMKTSNEEERRRIRMAPTPDEAKRLGSRITVRPGWEMMKPDVMRSVLRLKFQQNPELAERLIATGDARLVEDSPADRYWGTGNDGTGQNMLGQLLMEVRAELRATKASTSSPRAPSTRQGKRRRRT